MLMWTEKSAPLRMRLALCTRDASRRRPRYDENFPVACERTARSLIHANVARDVQRESRTLVVMEADHVPLLMLPPVNAGQNISGFNSYPPRFTRKRPLRAIYMSQPLTSCILPSKGAPILELAVITARDRKGCRCDRCPVFFRW